MDFAFRVYGEASGPASDTLVTAATALPAPGAAAAAAGEAILAEEAVSGRDVAPDEVGASEGEAASRGAEVPEGEARADEMATLTEASVLDGETIPESPAVTERAMNRDEEGAMQEGHEIGFPAGEATTSIDPQLLPLRVQVGAFKDPGRALAERDRLARLGFPADTVRVLLPRSGEWCRVLVGSFGSPAPAESLATALLEQPGVGDAFVVTRGGRGSIWWIPTRGSSGPAGD
jgi:hypothetical protein